MLKSEQINELATALSKAQGEIKGAIKDSSNPFFKSKYADLSSVVEAIRAAFTKHGLSYVQTVEPSEREEVRVETMILHSSGQYLCCGVLALPVTKADAQGVGSALTYARRYGLSAAAGVAPEDDDGNAAVGKGGVHKATDGAMETLSTDQQTFLADLANEVRDKLENDDVSGAVKWLDAAHLDVDHKTAIWTLFNSKERAAMKKVAQELRAK